MKTFQLFILILSFGAAVNGSLAAVSVHQGNWKLIRRFEPHSKYPEVRELYNLKEDIAETNNLASRMPDKVKELDALIDQFVEDTGALVPKPNPNFSSKVSKPLHGTNAGPIAGLVTRMCKVVATDGAIRITATGRQPFLGTGQVRLSGPLHHAIWTDLEGLFQHCRQRIAEVERQLARDLVQTPYVRLLAMPGVNVVLAAELAGEMGPITSYANANGITGRSGLYPSRYQSDQTDQNGPLIRKANRRIRCALMRIAESLACHCAYYRGLADTDRVRGLHTKASRVKTANKFTRVAFACVAGNEPMKHPAFQNPDSILEKLRQFHHVHKTPIGDQNNRTDWNKGSVLNSCEDPHRLSPPWHFAAFLVPGALSDHHRRIRQFGAVPLMNYLYGET